MLGESQILDAMRHIIDPDLGRDIVSLGFIKNLEIDGGRVRFTVELTTPACPVKEMFRTQCRDAVLAVPGVEAVEVTMGAMAPKRREGPGIDTLAEVDALVAVSSCKGGVGKSTVAAHLARTMQRQGLRVGLLDTDIHGPSVPTLFGLRNPAVYARDQLIQPLEVDGLKLMSMGFLLGENPAVLRGPIVSNYVQQILRQTEWGPLDYLILDLPPGTSDVQLTIVQQFELDGAIIVTTPQALSLVDVARGILMFDKVNVPVLGVVENMSWFDCGTCSERHYPFGNAEGVIQKRFGIPTLAELPIVPGISDISGRNAGPVPHAFVELADNVHRAVGKSRRAPKTIPELDVMPEAVQLRFTDGFEARIPVFELRFACPCARCVDEFTGRRTLTRDTIPPDIRIEGMRKLGHYAVSFAWSDGHTTGIYGWDFLRELADMMPAGMVNAPTDRD